MSTKFNVKDKRELYHQSNLVYYGKCSNQTCTEDYINYKIIINVIRTQTY